MSEIKVHPAAASVRLMDDEEYTGLIESMRGRGFSKYEPITLGRVNGSKESVLVDGRNRLRAAKELGIDPIFETIDFADDDAVKNFVDERERRRHSLKGQQAMRVAILYPEAKHGGVRKKGASSETELGVTKTRLSYARAVLRYSPELALDVRDGKTSLDDALKQVKDARKLAESKETQMERLRAEAPDLAVLVDEERMKVNEGIVVLDERKAKLEREQRSATDLLLRMVEMLHPRSAEPTEWADRMTADVRLRFWPQNAALPLNKETLQACATVINAIARKKWE